jgi:hypothetical protein
MGSGDGLKLTMDIPGIRALSEFVRGCGGDVRSAADGLRRLDAPSEQTLGDAAPAVQEFLTAWADELGVVAAGMDEVADTVGAAADGFGARDVKWSQNFQRFRDLQAG